ncbi:hypothetical protein PROFUN_06628 [Planoprotostelium fungivorum]|uniref:Rab-GAP TBC domain-containing protein n=1 Tax=Planoprotostelium fungivorum TaxID=1890364 RepID=A0A2P6MSV7_9EUKA|nr:hypothetical protein PROFUN_06628 [Planoprotostelium fungivorum]
MSSDEVDKITWFVGGQRLVAGLFPSVEDIQAEILQYKGRQFAYLRSRADSIRYDTTRRRRFMWIKPKPTSLGKLLWEVRNENNFFRLEYSKNVVGTSLVLEKPFRILLRRSEDTWLVVAVSDKEDEIRSDWVWIEKNLLHKLLQLGVDQSEKEEVLDFMVLKFESMAKPELHVSKREIEFKKTFNTDEKLLVHYQCSMWKGLYRSGRLYLSENFLAFSPVVGSPITISFRDIVSMKKRTNWGTTSAVLEVKGQEYFFSSFSSFDASFGVIEQLWKLSISKLLDHAEATKEKLEKLERRNSTSFSTKSPVRDSTSDEDINRGRSRSGTIGRRAHRMSMSINPSGSSGGLQVRSSMSLDQVDLTSKQSLLDAKKNLDFRNRLRLPKSEGIIAEFEGTVKNRGLFTPGAILITRHYLCFESYKEHSTLKQLSIVIPFRVVRSINKGRFPSSPTEELLVIIAEEDQIMFSTPQLDQVKNMAIKFWKVDLKVAKESHNKIVQFLKSSSTPFVDEEQFKQRAKWEDYFKLCNRPGPSTFRREPQLEELVLSGVPEESRGPLWMILSGALYKWMINADYYEELRRKYENHISDCTEDIEKDIHRSFPQHPEYQKAGNLDSLRRVLVAYSWRNPGIGYCQSMNNVAASLLLSVPEEAAFWLLCTLCEDIVPEYYSKVLVGTMVDMKIVDELVQSLYPRIFKHTTKLGITPGDITTPWFMCLFVGYLPIEATNRILDALFYRGRPILFHVAMAIFGSAEQSILTVKNPKQLRTAIEERARCFADYKQILQSAFNQIDNHISTKISETSHHGTIVQDIQQNYKKAELRELRNDTELSTFEIEEYYRAFRNFTPEKSLDDIMDETSFYKFVDEVVPAWSKNVQMKEEIWKECSVEDKIHFGDIISCLSIIKKGKLADRLEFCLALTIGEEEKVSQAQLLTSMESLLQLYGKTPDESVHRMIDIIYVTRFGRREEEPVEKSPKKSENYGFKDDDLVEDIPLDQHDDRNRSVSRGYSTDDLKLNRGYSSSSYGYDYRPMANQSTDPSPQTSPTIDSPQVGPLQTVESEENVMLAWIKSRAGNMTPLTAKPQKEEEREETNTEEENEEEKRENEEEKREEEVEKKGEEEEENKRETEEEKAGENKEEIEEKEEKDEKDEKEEIEEKKEAEEKEEKKEAEEKEEKKEAEEKEEKKETEEKEEKKEKEEEDRKIGLDSLLGELNASPFLADYLEL